MDSEPRFCENPRCTVGTWMVKQCFDDGEVWWVSDRRGHNSWKIAATAPVCPFCDTPLVTAIEIEEGIEESIEPEEGPLFEFVHGLE
ncbi:MAG: hypothetical protein M5U01_31520 [Ardenticatenaceae bacterium]|nr:hypothetical protein [Ardenticatenaceae bacterium]HBY94587.1 hypothetical protein [Chloroflexota bacterium]